MFQKDCSEDREYSALQRQDETKLVQLARESQIQKILRHSFTPPSETSLALARPEAQLRSSSLTPHSTWRQDAKKYLSISFALEACSFALEAWPQTTERDKAPRANFVRKVLLPKNYFKGITVLFSYAPKVTSHPIIRQDVNRLRVSFA